MSAPTFGQLFLESLVGMELPPSATQQPQDNVNNLGGAPAQVSALPVLQYGEPGPERLYGRFMNAECLQMIIHIVYCLFYVAFFFIFLALNEKIDDDDARDINRAAGVTVLILMCAWHAWIIVFRFFQVLSMASNYPKRSARIDPNNRFGVNHLAPFNPCAMGCFVGVSGFIMVLEFIWAIFAVFSLFVNPLQGFPSFIFQILVALNSWAVFKKHYYNNRYAGTYAQQPAPTAYVHTAADNGYYNPQQNTGYAAPQQDQPPQGYQAPAAVPTGGNNPYEPLV